MRSRLVVTGLTGYFALCALSALAPSQAQEREHGADHESEVAQLFRSQCISCHVVPEPGLATDRAWIRQLKDTA